MIQWWQKLSVAHPKIILSCAAIILAGLGVYGFGVFGNLSTSSDMNSDTTEAAKTAKKIENEFGGASASDIVVFERRDVSLGRADSPAYQAEVTKLLEPLRAEASNITTYGSSNQDTFISRDKTKTYAAVAIDGESKEVYKTLSDFRDNADDSKLKISIGGEAALNEQTNAQVSKELAMIELVSIPILLVFLLIFFRSTVAALVPIGIALCTIVGAFAFARFLAGFITIDTYAINVITILGLGLAIDYALLSVNRFREELPEGVDHAVRTIVATSGRTIVFSGITVIACLLALLAFPVEMMHSIAIGGASAVAMAVLVTSIMLPPTLKLIGANIDKGRIPLFTKKTQSTKPSIWKRAAQLVTRHPAVALTSGLIVVAIAFVPLLDFKPGIMDHNWVARGTEAHHAARVLANDFESPTSNITAFVELPNDMSEADRLRASCKLTTTFSAIDNVSSVISATPIDTSSDCDQLIAANAAGQTPNELAALQQQFAHSSALQFMINTNESADDKKTQQALLAVRDVKPQVGTLHVGGEAAVLYDNNRLYIDAAPKAIAIVIISMIILLALALRSVIVPIQAVIVNTIGLIISLAITVGVFQHGWFQNITGWPEVNGLVLAAPILVIAIAFGLAMDYSVFLYARMRETFDKTGDNTTAVITGVAKTGPIITAAALALFVVVVGFTLSSVLFMQIIGLGLAIAVVVDAFFVRLILVPSIMQLIGRASWWGPKFLDKIAIKHD